MCGLAVVLHSFTLLRCRCRVATWDSVMYAKIYEEWSPPVLWVAAAGCTCCARTIYRKKTDSAAHLFSLWQKQGILKSPTYFFVGPSVYDGKSWLCQCHSPSFLSNKLCQVHKRVMVQRIITRGQDATGHDNTKQLIYVFLWHLHFLSSLPGWSTAWQEA